MKASAFFALAALIFWAHLCTQRTLTVWHRIYAGLALAFAALELWGPLA